MEQIDKKREKTERQRDRETERQKDRETERQRQRNRETEDTDRQVLQGYSETSLTRIQKDERVDNQR